jgi:hypothetical protein
VNSLRAFLAAYREELSAIENKVHALQTDLAWLDDEIGDVIRDDRQLSLAQAMRRNLACDNLP